MRPKSEEAFDAIVFAVAKMIFSDRPDPTQQRIIASSLAPLRLELAVWFGEFQEDCGGRKHFIKANTPLVKRCKNETPPAINDALARKGAVTP